LQLIREGRVYGSLDPGKGTVLNGDQTNVSATAPGDGETLRAVQSGDTSALGVLLNNHGRSLYRICRTICSNREDAEDAVQETFLRALRSYNKFRGEANIKTWLSRIAVNVCIDSRRAKIGAERRFVLHDRLGADITSLDEDAVERLHLGEALEELSARQRTIFLLKELEGWTASEIARTLHCTQRHVYYELEKAHNILAEWRIAVEDAWENEEREDKSR